MTEGEWLQSENPALIFNSVFQLQSCVDRKVRLFACTCCRNTWHLLTDVRSRRAIEITELNVDGAAAHEELAEALAQAKQAWANARLWMEQMKPGKDKSLAALEAEAFQVPVWVAETRAAKRGRHWIAAIMVMANQALISRLPGTDQERQAARLRERQRSCVLLRDIVGNPFRPLPRVAPALETWNDGCIPKLATAIYSERDFSRERMGALADALEEAGVTDEEIMRHCRGPGPHVRGCWLVDLLTGKK